MADPIRLTVNGLPAPQGSKVKMPNGPMLDGTSKTGRANLKAWRDSVREACQRWLDDHPQPPITEPVKLTLFFRFPASASSPYRFWHATKPDLDKCVRATCDALKQGGLLRDDSLVSSIETTKTYASPLLPDAVAIGCDVVIEPLGAIEEQLREQMKARAAERRRAAKHAHPTTQDALL